MSVCQSGKFGENLHEYAKRFAADSELLQSLLGGQLTLDPQKRFKNA